MRISADSGDIGWHQDYFRCEVYIDGVKRDGVITADDVDGFAIVYDLDNDGNIVLINGDIQRKEIRGDIRFVVPLGFVATPYAE